MKNTSFDPLFYINSETLLSGSHVGTREKWRMFVSTHCNGNREGSKVVQWVRWSTNYGGPLTKFDCIFPMSLFHAYDAAMAFCWLVSATWPWPLLTSLIRTHVFSMVSFHKLTWNTYRNETEAKIWKSQCCQAKPDLSKDIWCNERHPSSLEQQITDTKSSHPANGHFVLPTEVCVGIYG